MNKQIKTIEFIRDLQVKKRRRHLLSAEKEVRKMENEIGGVDAEMRESAQRFESKKKEILQELQGKRTSVDALYLLKQREMANYHLIKEKKAVIEDLSQDLINKRLIKKERQKALWNSEKGLIKIQEFIKIEAQNE